MARQNEELNKAIWKVLQVKFKKDAPEAFKMVQEAGYEVMKGGQGQWIVKNPHTRKMIDIQDTCRGTVLYHGNYQTQVRVIAKYGYKTVDNWTIVGQKFDFVNCLKTPMNRDYYDALDVQCRQSESIMNYDRLKSAKWSIDYDEREIARLQKEVEKLQKDIARRYEAKVNDLMHLNNVRRELGLA